MFSRPLFTPRVRILVATLIAALLWLNYTCAKANQTRAQSSSIRVIPTAAVAHRLAEQRHQPCDMIFIGASNVEYWTTQGKAVWDHFYAPRHAFNFGEGGDRTQDTLWRLNHMDLSGLHPKVAVIFVGLNNLGEAPCHVALGVKAVADKSRALFPGAKVIVASLSPNGRDDAQVVETNRYLAQWAARKAFFYVDLYPLFPRTGDTWKGLMPDRLHFTESGYESWANAMEPLIQDVLPLDPAVADAAAKP